MHLPAAQFLLSLKTPKAQKYLIAILNVLQNPGLTAVSASFIPAEPGFQSWGPSPVPHPEPNTFNLLTRACLCTQLCLVSCGEGVVSLTAPLDDAGLLKQDWLLSGLDLDLSDLQAVKIWGDTQFLWILKSSMRKPAVPWKSESLEPVAYVFRF